MPARTGEQFLRGLKGAREIWVGQDKVEDITAHPAFAGAAQGLAGVFDLQHRYADDCLMADPETGEPINASHMIRARRRTSCAVTRVSRASRNTRSASWGVRRTT